VRLDAALPFCRFAFDVCDEAANNRCGKGGVEPRHSKKIR
jgi:hypothetical protein